MMQPPGQAMTSRIVFVPGMKPKPAPHLYREQLLRALGTGLKRVRIGRVRLGALPIGQWRYLRPDEKF